MPSCVAQDDAEEEVGAIVEGKKTPVAVSNKKRKAEQEKAAPPTSTPSKQTESNKKAKADASLATKPPSEGTLFTGLTGLVCWVTFRNHVKGR